MKPATDDDFCALCGVAMDEIHYPPREDGPALDVCTHCCWLCRHDAHGTAS